MPKLSADDIAQSRAWFESLPLEGQAALEQKIKGMTPEQQTAHILAEANRWASKTKRGENLEDFSAEQSIRRNSDLDKYKQELQLRRQPSEAFIDRLSEQKTQAGKLQNIVDFIENDREHAEDYGPLDNLLYKGGKMLGIDMPEYEYANEQIGLTPAAIRKSLTGATATEQELEEFASQLPSMSNYPDKNLRIARQLIDDIQRERQNIIGIRRALGYDLEGVEENLNPTASRQPYPTENKEDVKPKPKPILIKNVPADMLNRGNP